MLKAVEAIKADLKLANLSQDGQIVQYARDIATEILDSDHLLERSENSLLRIQLSRMTRSAVDWSKIS